MPKRWNVFQADQAPGDHITDLPEAPPWRRFSGEVDEKVQLS